MKRFLTVILAFAAVLFAVSCGDDGTKDPAVGSEGGDCYVDGTCDGNLVCLSNVCVDSSETPDKDTVVNDTAQPDNIQADDVVTDTEQPDETADTEQPDVDYSAVKPGEMVDVPAGEFQMGCNVADDDECSTDELPYHAVTLSAYKIGKYEVTVGEYQQCVTNGACNNSSGEIHYNTNADDPACNLGAEGKENHPMQCVTWYGAKAYCEYLGQRLPTEAEWEKAARGTDGRKYPWGNEIATCDHAVMFDSNAGGGGCGADGTMPIGSKEMGKSPYGAYDMAGNVWEWVNDWYDLSYYTSSPANDPAGPETGEYRVLRGGSWNDYNVIHDLRTVHRNYGNPGYYLDRDDGFRCAE
jgi:formylglycine-generating enzyme required for sulfatase activity